MIEEIKLEGLDTVCQAIKNAIDSAGVDTTGATAGQVLTATEDETTHEISATWEDPEKELPTITAADNGKTLQAVYDSGATSVQWVRASSASYKINTETPQIVGQYEEVNTGTSEVTVHPIKTKYIATSGTWGNTSNYGPTFALTNVYKILSVTVIGTWREDCEIMEKAGVFYDPTETVWKTYRTGNAVSDIYVSAVIVEYAETV